MTFRVTCDCGACRKCKHRVYMRGWYERNAEKVLERQRQNRRVNPPRDPVKRKAQQLVYTEVRAGRLIPQPCEACGDKGEAHHDDYDSTAGGSMALPTPPHARPHGDDMRPGWYEVVDYGSDGKDYRCRFTNADGYARIQGVGVTATTAQMLDQSEAMLERLMVHHEDRILAEGGTIVVGLWPEGTKFDDLPEDYYGGDDD